MQIILVRHASAEDREKAELDEERRLTDAGRVEAKTTGRALRALGVKPDLILTSPLVRAVQTAEIIARVFRGLAVKQERLLGPAGDWALLDGRVKEVQRKGARSVILVGHRPHLNEYIARLIGDGKGQVVLSKSGAACVEITETSSTLAGELKWLMHRDQLAMLSEVS